MNIRTKIAITTLLSPFIYLGVFFIYGVIAVIGTMIFAGFFVLMASGYGGIMLGLSLLSLPVLAWVWSR